MYVCDEITSKHDFLFPITLLMAYNTFNIPKDSMKIRERYLATIFRSPCDHIHTVLNFKSKHPLFPAE